LWVVADPRKDGRPVLDERLNTFFEIGLGKAFKHEVARLELGPTQPAVKLLVYLPLDSR
jgi:hypothetical protein